MLKKQIILLFALVFTLPLAMAVVAQEAPAKAKEARVEGNIIRTSKDDSTLTVRKVGTTNEERIVHYDSSTRWVSQYHGDTKVNDIDPSQVKEGDRVICTGTWEKSGALHATLISQRLSHSPH
jgi:esterase/lipase superfamily enzyme